ncbi:hypothetical protein C8259_08865 [Nocardia nova]|uniref:Uncharacterized protein n=2 Tax=Nocardiaceae TaxID=85025 RepID=A0A2T2Z863_9NOCA|nr:hypothetical protein C8259_08865 [Nocardia nova]
MTETPTLDELVETASARHNGASGRRLADIAQKAGYEVSHATLNRIRRGTYTSTPTDQTLKAIAFLAGVDPKVAFAALAAQNEATRHTAELYYQWARLQLQSRRLTHEYAHAREISVDEAEDELAEIFEMDEDRRQGRPWTPPWDPGPEYSEDDTPWLRSWWSDPPKQDARGVYTMNLPRWMHGNIPIGGDAEAQQVGHILSRHPGSMSFVLQGIADESAFRTIVYLAVANPSTFRADLAEQDLQGFLNEDRHLVELVVVDKIPTSADGGADIDKLTAIRNARLTSTAAPPRRDSMPPFNPANELAAWAHDKSDIPPDDYEDGIEDRADDEDFEGR